MPKRQPKVNFKDSAFFLQKKTYAAITVHEMNLFKKHQSLSWPLYRQLRINYLKAHVNTDLAIDFISVFMPKTAVFPGSFNPFHMGHWNVLKQAEQSFDKVIIAIGTNTQKTSAVKFKLPKCLYAYEIIKYRGLLTDCIKAIEMPVTVIRGLRNSADFQFEEMQLRYLQDTMPRIPVMYIIPDREVMHLSSSGIRSLKNINQHLPYIMS
jgi:pantetheine-phosphate adenylyltransferase